MAKDVLDLKDVDIAASFIFEIPKEVIPLFQQLSMETNVQSTDTLCAYFLHEIDCCNIDDENELVEAFVTNAFKDCRVDSGWFRTFDGKVAKHWDDTYLSSKQEDILVDIALALSKALKEKVGDKLDYWLNASLRYRFGYDWSMLPIMVMTSKRERK